MSHNLDKAVEELKHYDNYPNSKVHTYIDGIPIVIYYYNDITSLENIFNSLKQVFDNELIPFKIHFQQP